MMNDDDCHCHDLGDDYNDDGDDNDDDDDLSNGGAVQGEAALYQLWSVNADNIVVIIMRMRIMLMRSTMIMGMMFIFQCNDDYRTISTVSIQSF